MKKYCIFFILIFALKSTIYGQNVQYYNEKFRPQYHFSPEKNYLGAPCGLVAYDGEYHLFYQHNPRSNEPEYFHWGHAVSNDLLHWEHKPVAIVPDNQSEDKEFCTAGPGSIIVDHNNTLGVQSGNNKTFVAFYTSYQCGQRIAYSNDKGTTWKKYDKNPIISEDDTKDAIGPKVFWYEPGQFWVMLLTRNLDNDERKKGFSIYTSANLTDWNYESHVAGFKGSADLIEVKVNNRSDDKRWVLISGNGDYMLGAFDGKTFLAETIRMKCDFGDNYDSPQTFVNIPESDGRIIQIACMSDADFKDMPFSGLMTFPSQLSLKKINSGTFLIRQPIDEIERLYEKTHSWENKKLIPGINFNLLKSVKGDCLRIKGQFDLMNCEAFGFVLRLYKKTSGVELTYNVKRQVLSIFGQSVPLEPVDNKISLDILIDRASIEVYANNGRAVMTNSYMPDDYGLDYFLYNTGGEINVDKLEITGLNTVWREAEGKKKSKKK
ncbi:MAG: glycoside hydrolase family 32 protein [Prolixibacteraceae bacterium]|nr:glycoside hydrolase family 32 protein [Prolixibacteraceae bacterium]